MSERPETCVRLLVEGRAQLQFFQVLLIATDSFDAAQSGSIQAFDRAADEVHAALRAARARRR